MKESVFICLCVYKWFFRNIIKLIFINIIEGEDFKMDYYKTSIDAFTDIADRFDKVTKALLKKVFGTFK